MLFSSTTFLYGFLPAVLLGYFVLFRWTRPMQNVFLLLASLVFYAWGEPRFVLVMMGSILLNWAFGLLVDRFRDRRHMARLWLILDLAFNLAILFVFKYLGFTGRLAYRVFGLELALPEIALPIGISFFTFQAISYVADVYRKRAEVQPNLLYVGLYISFFPQLIAGPIVRYQTIADQILNRRVTADDVFDGFARFVVGLAKKVLLANSLSVLAGRAFDGLHAGESLSVLFAWLGAIAYTLQIYFDFSGYSDMAIGLSRMFGFRFPENFDLPYTSASVSEFWRRWHISLGTWFRDYVYIPLGGNRGGRGRVLCNLFAVWFLTGLWHGANVTFVVWGLMYFVLIAAEKLAAPHRPPRVLGRCYTLLFVALGWVIFRSASIGDAALYLKSLFGLCGNPLSDGLFTGYLTQNLPLLAISILFSTSLFRQLREKTEGSAAMGWLRTLGLILLLVLSVASLVSSSYNPFIYFNF